MASICAAERRDSRGVDRAGRCDPGAKFVSWGRGVVGEEAELGVGAAVDLAEQAPVLGQPDGFVPVLPAGQLGLETGRAHDRDVVRSSALDHQRDDGRCGVAQLAPHRL